VSVIELAIAPGRAAGSFRVEVVRSAAGEASAEVVLDVDTLLARREQVEHAVLASGKASRGVLTEAERPLREIGQALFEALLGSGDINGRYRASAALAAEQGQGLRVVLRIDTPALAGLPWEAMYDTVAGGYVCRLESLVRHVPVAAPVPPLKVRSPLRILGIVSAPRGLGFLDTGLEKEQLTRALDQPRASGLIEIHWAAKATWAALQDLLLGDEWHVAHFIGHGDFDISRDEGAIYLTREDGRPDMIEADQLVDLLREARPMPRLVVLNSCSGATIGANDLFAGTAAALVRGGVSAVAAMQWPISDGAACAFARGFYTAIAHGRGVDDATRSGRVAIVGTHSRTLEWVTPVMYLRGRDSHLFILDPSARPSPAPERSPVTSATDVEPAPRSHAPATGWSWERYAAELNIPAGRIDVGRRLVAAIETAMRERGLTWQVVMRKGYVGIQRPGGFNVLVVDVWWNRAPRLAGKFPAEPATIGLSNPFPHLPELWIPAEHEWGWTVSPGTPLPDVGALIDLVRPFQPPHSPMAVPAAAVPAAGSNQPGPSVPQTAGISSEIREGILRLASSAASSNVGEAANGLLALGYQFRLAKSRASDRLPQNYLRIMDPAYTAHGVGYLTPTMFSFSRASDRDRLAGLPGAVLAGEAVNFPHAGSAEPGLTAARLLMNEQGSA
jgi:CHAT domain